MNGATALDSSPLQGKLQANEAMRGFDTTLSLQSTSRQINFILDSQREKGPGSETLEERVLTSFLPYMWVWGGGGILEIKPQFPLRSTAYSAQPGPR